MAHQFDTKEHVTNLLMESKERLQRMRDSNDRSLLIGRGSEPRVSVLLDRVQFLNNSLTKKIAIPAIVSNGVIELASAYTDLTVKECLFKDNYYPTAFTQVSQYKALCDCDISLKYQSISQKYSFILTLQERGFPISGFAAKVESSATLDITNTCFVNDYFQNSGGPIVVNADSGLVSSNNNYVSETPMSRGEPISPCQYIFKKEAYKCVAPESNVCALPACAASYKLYNAFTDKVVTTIVNGGTIASPPCDVNIEAVLPCATTGKNVTVQLFNQKGSIAKSKDEVVPFFLFGNNNKDIGAGKIAAGTYKIQALANGVVQPSPVTFTLGKCVRS
jgi:hypothetical protein